MDIIEAASKLLMHRAVEEPCDGPCVMSVVRQQPRAVERVAEQQWTTSQVILRVVLCSHRCFGAQALNLRSKCRACRIAHLWYTRSSWSEKRAISPCPSKSQSARTCLRQTGLKATSGIQRPLRRGYVLFAIPTNPCHCTLMNELRRPQGGCRGRIWPSESEGSQPKEC
jgi:hypothetical protein